MFISIVFTLWNSITSTRPQEHIFWVQNMQRVRNNVPSLSNYSWDGDWGRLRFQTLVCSSGVLDLLRQRLPLRLGIVLLRLRLGLGLGLGIV